MNLENINYLQLKRDIEDIRLKLEQIPDIDSSKHFWRIYNISQFFYWFGLITLPLNPYYIFNWLSLCIGIFSKWTMIGHHVCHGGYDNNKDVIFNRKTFGIKSVYRRTVDWLDWWLVEAWNIEHNNLHHYYLGETEDPDLLEENLIIFRESKLPFFIKKLLIIFLVFHYLIYFYHKIYSVLTHHLYFYL